MPRKKILITGSQGFVGRNLRRVLEPDYDIAGFDISLSVFHNITAQEQVYAFFEKERPNIVIHLAANPDVAKSAEFPQEDLYLNTLGTINVLEACRRYPVELMFLSSSAVVYGELETQAFSESHPLRPTTPYGIGKLAAEQYCNLYFRRYQVPAVIFRLFNIYGPGQSRNFAIPNMVARIREAGPEMEMFGNEHDTRDFVFIEDICEAFRTAIEKKPAGCTFNIATGKETRLLEVAETIARVLNKSVRFFYKPQAKDANRVTRILGDPSFVARTIGWKSRFNLEAGLTKLIHPAG